MKFFYNEFNLKFRILKKNHIIAININFKYLINILSKSGFYELINGIQGIF